MVRVAAQRVGRQLSASGRKKVQESKRCHVVSAWCPFKESYDGTDWKEGAESSGRRGRVQELVAGFHGGKRSQVIYPREGDSPATGKGEPGAAGGAPAAGGYSAPLQVNQANLNF